MPRFTVCRTVGREEADRLVVPRDDIVAERPERADGDADAAAAGDGDGGRRGRVRMVLDRGPFSRYERTVTAAPAGNDGLVSVTQDFDYRLPPGTWPFLMNWPFRAALRHPRADGKLPWW